MASITIPNIPEDLHHRLKSAAERDERSIEEDVLHILEEAIPTIPPLQPVRAVEPLKPFTHEWLLEAIREDRE